MRDLRHGFWSKPFYELERQISVFHFGACLDSGCNLSSDFFSTLLKALF
jgi:hypothetical protein